MASSVDKCRRCARVCQGVKGGNLGSYPPLPWRCRSKPPAPLLLPLWALGMCTGGTEGHVVHHHRNSCIHPDVVTAGTFPEVAPDDDEEEEEEEEEGRDQEEFLVLVPQTCHHFLPGQRLYVVGMWSPQNLGFFFFPPGGS